MKNQFDRFVSPFEEQDKLDKGLIKTTNEDYIKIPKKKKSFFTVYDCHLNFRISPLNRQDKLVEEGLIKVDNYGKFEQGKYYSLNWNLLLQPNLTFWDIFWNTLGLRGTENSQIKSFKK